MMNTPAHSSEAAMIEPNQTAFILKVTRPDEAAWEEERQTYLLY